MNEARALPGGDGRDRHARAAPGDRHGDAPRPPLVAGSD
jgi:hypothetical protein